MSKPVSLPLNPKLAAKARDNRAKQVLGSPDPSTPNTPKRTSAASSATPVVTSQPIPPSPQNVSAVPVKEHMRTPPQPRNISDPSYTQLNPQAATNRIGDQMRVAQTDPRRADRQTVAQEKLQRQESRDKLAEKPRNGFNPLNTKQESGSATTFGAAAHLQHRIQRDTEGRKVTQEVGRPTKLALNTRPSQRVHNK